MLNIFQEKESIIIIQTKIIKNQKLFQILNEEFFGFLTFFFFLILLKRLFFIKLVVVVVKKLLLNK